jgi:hypothetical protein
MEMQINDKPRKKTSIGLVTWSLEPNYGTVLQAYSLYHTLEKLGCKVFLLNKFDTNFTLKSFKDALFRRLGIRRFWKYAHVRKTVKMERIKKFHRKEFRQKTIATKYQFRQLLKNTNIFMTGSDQLWNCYDHFIPFLFLDFAEEKTKVSYATSIGTTDIPAAYKQAVKDFLLKYKKISVREETAKDILTELTGRNDIEHVLDPTFLIDSSEWKRFGNCATEDFHLPEKYICCYLLGKDNHYKEYIETIKRKTGIKNIIIIPSGENPDLAFNGAVIYNNAGIREFVRTMDKASFVCTDSFHGTALSINLSKQFVVLRRFKDSDRKSQNSRLYDLLDTLDISNRFFDDKEDGWDKIIDYNAVDTKLDILKRKSMDFITDAITI